MKKKQNILVDVFLLQKKNICFLTHMRKVRVERYAYDSVCVIHTMGFLAFESLLL